MNNILFALCQTNRYQRGNNKLTVSFMIQQQRSPAAIVGFLIAHTVFCGPPRKKKQRETIWKQDDTTECIPSMFGSTMNVYQKSIESSFHVQHHFIVWYWNSFVEYMQNKTSDNGRHASNITCKAQVKYIHLAIS